MTMVTCDMAMSVDGYVAGTDQRLDEPFGDGPRGRLHRWMVEQPERNAAEVERITAAGAYIMGRNMFGPGRGECASRSLMLANLGQSGPDIWTTNAKPP